MALLEIKDLNFTYSGASAPALDSVSFSVGPGEIVLLCGPNGCGKSTLLSAITSDSRLRGERSGEVNYQGRKIGFVGQSSSVFITDTVQSELAFASENAQNTPEITERRVGEVAAILGIERLLDRNLSELSGGEGRLVSLGAALINAPELLVLDEPAANLDPVTAARFYDTLVRISREMGISALISEHRTEELIDRADRVLVMKGGRAVTFCRPSELSALENDPELRGFLPISARVAARMGKCGELPLSIADGRKFLDSERARLCQIGIAEENFPERERVLSVRDLYFSYSKNSPDILRGLDLTLCRGEALCLLGGNGSGKSTLLSVVAGLRRGYFGELRVLGKKLSSYKGNSLYSGCVALLLQDVRALFIHETVREELAGADADLPFDLSHLYDRHPYDLSGGEARLVGLAIALAAKPQILLLDEPTGGVDPSMKKMIGELLCTLKNRGVSILCVTHDADFAPLFADRCLLLSRGRAVGEGGVREFFSQGEYYTTSASRLARGFIDSAVTEEDILLGVRRD